VVILLNEEILLSQLEELAQKLGATVRLENINMEESTSTGGLCRVGEEYIIIVHSRASIKEKIKVLAEAVRHFDLTDIYIKPAIRQLIEGNEE
jgi:hypothetical protein